MKVISFSIPCFNEENNVRALVTCIKKIFENQLTCYDYSIEFIDNKSTDSTRSILRDLCREDPKHIRAIFNSRNFGGVSNYYGLLQTVGDCCIVLPCDFQVPLEIVPQLIKKWETGSKIVCAVKKGSDEKKRIWHIRSLYYKIIGRFSKLNMISHFTGAGLYDKNFINWLITLNDPIPSLRGMVVEYGFGIDKVYYVEQKRRTGKTKQSFLGLFNVAMRNMINYTQALPRIATFLGMIISFTSIIIGIIYLILKVLFWNEFTSGIAPLMFGVFFIGGIQLAFLGLFGEYLMIINERLLNRPLVTEEVRLNYEEKSEQ